jgi:hypothetical protein
MKLTLNTLYIKQTCHISDPYDVLFLFHIADKVLFKHKMNKFVK